MCNKEKQKKEFRNERKIEKNTDINERKKKERNFCIYTWLVECFIIARIKGLYTSPFRNRKQSQHRAHDSYVAMHLPLDEKVNKSFSLPGM